MMYCSVCIGKKQYRHHAYSISFVQMLGIVFSTTVLFQHRVFGIVLHSPRECRTNVPSGFVKVQVCMSSCTSLMFKEALTSLQASIAASDTSVCTRGAAWLRSTQKGAAPFLPLLLYSSRAC